MSYQLNSIPSINLSLTSRGTYRGQMHNPTFLLMKGVNVPLKTEAMLSVNKVMMNQPDVLDEMMTLNVKVTYVNPLTPPRSHTVSLKSLPKFYTVRNYLHHTAEVIKSNNGMQIYLAMLLEMLNSNNVVGATTEYVFTLGFPDATFYGTQDPMFFTVPIVPDANNNGAFGTNDGIVCDLFNFFSNGRGFLKLQTKDATVSNVTITGSALRVLDMSPNTAVTFDADYLHPIRVMNKGHDYIVLRTNQCRNTIDNMKPGTLADYSNVLTIIPCEGTQYINYFAYTVGSKILLNDRNLEDIELYFEDKWGLPLYGIRDFYVELTIDFVNLKAMIPQANMMDLKRDFSML